MKSRVTSIWDNFTTKVFSIGWLRWIINRRFASIIASVLAPLLPLDMRRSVSWLITYSEKQRLIRDLLEKTTCSSRCDHKRILFWEPGGMSWWLNRPTIIATALRTWGVEARFVICDGAPHACVRRDVVSGKRPSLWSKWCPGCLRDCASEVDSFNLPYDGIGELVSEERCSELRILAQMVPSAELAKYRHNDVEVGQLAISSTARYFKGLPIEEHEDIVREYLYAGLVNTEAAITVIARFKPDILVTSHACYVDYGPAFSIATNAGIPMVLWQDSYLERHQYMQRCIQSSDRSYQIISEEAWRQRSEQPLTRHEDERLESYLNARYTTDAAFDVKVPPPIAIDELRRKLDIHGDKPVWCIFTHLTWDDAFNVGSEMAFDNIEQWVIDTLRTIITLPGITWLVKVHPAEIRWRTAYSVQSLIKEHFPELPPHVRVIPPDADINMYGLYSIADGGVTVFGTPGLEMAVLGKPVILAGDAHYGSKGFTYTSLTKEEYRALLCRAAQLPKLSAAQQALARQYAYSYFIQRQIPLQMVEKGYRGFGQLDYNKLDLLLPGKDKAMTMICEQILKGGDFIMDEDMIAFYSALK